MSINKQFVVMCAIVLLTTFFGTWIASSSIERVGLAMQETLCK